MRFVTHARAEIPRGAGEVRRAGTVLVLASTLILALRFLHPSKIRNAFLLSTQKLLDCLLDIVPRASNMPINVAVLGSGLFVAGAYIPALSANTSDVVLHTLWSRSQASVENILKKATEAGLKPTTLYGNEGLEKVLGDKDIDAVMLVLPITAQPALVIRALKAGKHVLSEKPVAKDVKDARELIETYEKEYKPKGLIWRVAESMSKLPKLSLCFRG